MSENAASTALRIASAFMALVFLVAASAQFNDPDGLAWVALYGSAAAASALVAAARLASWVVPALISAVALVALGVVAFEDGPAAPFAQLFDSWKMTGASIEKSRELGGLLIVAAWMGGLAGAAFRRRKGDREHASEPESRGHSRA